MTSQPIRFLLNDTEITLPEAAPDETLLDFLRLSRRLTGAKEGCAEGDCGACTVVLASLVDGQVEMKTVNACIQLTPTLDGKALFSVEDLQQPDGALHPVQQAMVECHGSQCGFCTPGFVMSLWGMYLKKDGATPTRCEIDDGLSGNLCRCTGYRPIIDAARRMSELPKVTFDRAALAQQLQDLQRDSLHTYAARGQQFHAPRTVDELAQLRADKPQATLLAGSTDVGLWVTKQMRELGEIIYLGNVAALKTIAVQDDMLDIGAGASLNDAYAALCEHYPEELSELWQRFASLPIRNAGTLGGNVANGSPIGDSMPWLIALGTQIVLRGPAGQRTMALEDFYLGYQKKDLRPDEFVEALKVPLPRAQVKFRTYKLAKRFDQDISAVCAAFAFELDGERIVNARIAFGGMAATPQRATQTETFLRNQMWTEENLVIAMGLLADDYAPLSDMRATNTYRMTTAQNLLRRFWLETRHSAPMLRASLNAYACRA